ncbi:MAG: hypothetical protein ACJ8GN_22075 [Longimicrobiaceae bacterium]
MRLSTLAAAVLLAAAAASPARLVAQPDTARLRQALDQAIGRDFRIVRHELSNGLPERGGTFWLVHVHPRRSGYFQLRYRYEYVDGVHPENPLYTHVQHESSITVGERGCHRRQRRNTVCLGDTLVLPFVVNNFTGHTFTLAWRGPVTEPPEPPAGYPAPVPGSAPNPAGAHLEYLGSRAEVMLHRIPGSTTVYSASFRALAPGRFNLSLRAASAVGAPPALDLGSGSVPVIVVARGQPVTVLLSAESVTGVDERHGFSSHSGNEYLTTPLLLQPGDRISLEFLRYTVRGRDAPERLDLEPVITSLPFALDRRDRFNAWIADHLPGR